MYVKSFPGAKTIDMVDYSKPTLRCKSGVIIYHAGTNDLHLKENNETIANDIIKLALDTKTADNEVAVSRNFDT